MGFEKGWWAVHSNPVAWHVAWRQWWAVVSDHLYYFIPLLLFVVVGDVNCLKLFDRKRVTACITN
jgi:hypothetical protein